MSSEDIASIVAWAVIGLVAGWIASLIVGGTESIVGFLVAGLLGSLVGGYLARQFRLRLNLGNLVVEQIVISVIGAVVVLVIWRLLT